MSKTVHAIIFDKSKWTEEKAWEWLNRKNFRAYEPRHLIQHFDDQIQFVLDHRMYFSDLEIIPGASAGIWVSIGLSAPGGSLFSTSRSWSALESICAFAVPIALPPGPKWLTEM